MVTPVFGGNSRKPQVFRQTVQIQRLRTKCKTEKENKAIERNGRTESVEHRRGTSQWKGFYFTVWIESEIIEVTRGRWYAANAVQKDFG